MVITSWKDKRNEIYRLIKKISDHYGGDAAESLKEYCSDIITTYKDDLDKPLACFKEMEKGINELSHQTYR